MAPAKVETEEEWESVVKPFPQEVKFATEGGSFVGTFLSTQLIELTDDEGNPRPTKLHVLEKDGEEFSIWGSKNLDDGFAKVPVGSVTRVVYVRTVPLKGGHTVREFDIAYRK